MVLKKVPGYIVEKWRPWHDRYAFSEADINVSLRTEEDNRHTKSPFMLIGVSLKQNMFGWSEMLNIGW